MTNFDFLKADKRFDAFADVAISAERILHIDVDASVLNCRRAMEFAVKWMYSVDSYLSMPYDTSLNSLMNNEDFREIVGQDIWQRMRFVRISGNNVAHSGKKITLQQAEHCIENLFIFLDFVACCYAKEYTPVEFDHSLLLKQESSEKSSENIPDIDFEALIAENKALKEELTARREEQQQSYIPKPLDITEFKTRKLYINTMLTDAGWIEGVDWLNEVLPTMVPSSSLRLPHTMAT